jgi:energy-coupling factor transporter transmembrane protein EcfT
VAEVSLFAYSHGSSPVHRIDPRVKIVCLLALAAGSSAAGGLGVGLLTAYVALLWLLAGLSPARLGPAIGPLLLLVSLVVLARTATDAGSPLRGFLLGLLFGWRLLLMAVVATLFLSTTKTTALKAAVASLLAKLPGVPAGRIALMFGLTLGSLPELMRQLEETKKARLARLVELRRSPVSRILSLVVPLGRRLLTRADETALAMEARCYVDERPPRAEPPTPRDWAALFAGVLLPSIAAFL